uniref:Uncharacterized protein n=1 Tax=Anguilla anguilla TaxID=7936 RepID=A0A0E9X0K0_ANGAN
MQKIYSKLKFCLTEKHTLIRATVKYKSIVTVTQFIFCWFGSVVQCIVFEIQHLSLML